MFRALICQSSGVCDYVVELPYWLISFLVWSVLELGCGSARVVSGLPAEAQFLVFIKNNTLQCPAFKSPDFQSCNCQTPALSRSSASYIHLPIHQANLPTIHLNVIL